MIHNACLFLLLSLFICAMPAANAGDSLDKKNKIPEKLPISGQSLAGMEQFDQQISDFMKRWQIPGGSLAIMYKGKLTYARGYGYADFSQHKLVQPDSLFRMASIAKVLTAVAILRLVDEGKLRLSDNVAAILNYPPDPRSVRAVDSRLGKITVQHCLEGTGGWDRSSNGDPMFVPIVQEAALEYSNSLRPTPKSIIRYQFSRPLDFTPGSRYSYSNLEYSILGEVISKISGMSYADFVKEKILAPMGLSRVIPGKTRELAPSEVTYYGFPGENKGPSVLPNIREMLPLEYGGDFYLESMTADCGWVASAKDMARFVSCVFGDCSEKLQPLSPKLTKLMIARPPLKSWEDASYYFAMGWEVSNAKLEKDIIVKKEGSLPGSAALAFHKSDGTTVVLVFNSRPQMALEFQARLMELILANLAKNSAWKTGEPSAAAVNAEKN